VYDNPAILAEPRLKTPKEIGKTAKSDQRIARIAMNARIDDCGEALEVRYFAIGSIVNFGNPGNFWALLAPAWAAPVSVPLIAKEERRGHRSSQ
jgi:hypothetical protein